MKKLTALFLFLFAAVTLTAADVYKFPGWKCNDEATLTAAVAAAPEGIQKIRDTILLSIVKQPPASYAAYCADVDRIVDAATQYDQKEYARVLFKKQIPYCRGIFIVDAWAFCLKNPTSYDLYFHNRAKELGFTPAQKYQLIVRSLTGYNYNVTTVRAALDAMLDAAIEADGTSGVDVKADLKKLNRKYSKNLLDDKTAWEPVVAKIRTTLETY